MNNAWNYKHDNLLSNDDKLYGALLENPSDKFPKVTRRPVHRRVEKGIEKEEEVQVEEKKMKEAKEDEKRMEEMEKERMERMEKERMEDMVRQRREMQESELNNEQKGSKNGNTWLYILVAGIVILLIGVAWKYMFSGTRTESFTRKYTGVVQKNSSPMDPYSPSSSSPGNL